MYRGGEAERLEQEPSRSDLTKGNAGLGEHHEAERGMQAASAWEHHTKPVRDGGLCEETWSRVKRRLRAELGEDVFSSWLARLEMVALTESAAKLSVPTRFLKSWIEAHYAERVLSVYQSEDATVRSLSIVVRGASDKSAMRAPAGMPARGGDEARPAGPGASAPAVAEERPAAAATSAEERGGDIASAPLDTRLTFESFVVGRSNALAQAAADRIARHESGPSLYNPLYLQAGVGLGKTHLLHAIGNQARALGKRVIYLTADRFM